MRTRPKLSIDLPTDDWAFKEQLTALTGSGDPMQVRANVVASSEPIDPEMDAKTYADIATSQLEQEFPAYNQIRFEEMDLFGDNPGWLRRFEWQPEPGRRLIQLQGYYATEGRGFTVTATAEADDFDEYEARLVDALMSMRIEQ